MVDFKDEDGKHYGDWQKRDLRKNANEIHQSPAEKPWYMQNFWIIALLLVIWPVGMYLVWKSDWAKNIKIIVTVVVAALVVGGMYTYNQVLAPVLR